MKAAILTELNKPLRIADVQTTRLEYGQVLVKVLASGICGAQLQEIRGEKGGPLPHLMGHEGCGVVVDVGEGVANVKPHQRVVMHWRQGAGAESPFPKYIYEGSTITSGRVTTFSEYSVCSENRLTPVPDDTPEELCALLGCGLSTALGTIENEANLLMGESVLIIGCGGLGINLIRAARMRLAGHIAATDVYDEKKKLAIEIGADSFYNTSTGQIKEKFDVIIDTAGNGYGMQSAVTNLAPSGRYIMVGQPKPGEMVPLINARHLFEGNGKTIKATQGGMFNPTSDVPRYVKLWESGQLNLSGIITHRTNLDGINAAIDLVRKGMAGRILITP